jgi:glucose-6-phosphate isomerase
VSGPPGAIEARIPTALQGAVAERVALARSEQVTERIAAADASLWGEPGTPEISNRLGWLTIAGRTRSELEELLAFAAELRDERVTDAVVLGMGGSSLAPEVLRRTFVEPGAVDASSPRLHVLDSTDATTIRAVEHAVDPARTLFFVSSKSGGTIEPLSLFAHFHSVQRDGRGFAAITDPGTGLELLAGDNGFRSVFHGDPDIGGRYSALSAFGIVPAAATGIDVGALLDGAQSAWDTPLADGSGDGLAGAVWLGAALAALAREGRDKLTFVIAPTLPGLGLWLEQLFAESTGKHGTGILPVAEEPLGRPGDYGEDRVFAHLPDTDADADPETAAAVAALADAGHPVVTIPARGPTDLGRIFLLSEIAVAAAGWGLAINPFDQPNVQQAKDATNRVLAEYEADPSGSELGRGGPAPADLDAVRDLLLGAEPPEYVALMAYAQPSGALSRASGELRAAIRQATRATTTFGYGPRFLHSTGQFHKGGPPTGRFLQLLHDGPDDVAIPGASYSFTTLKEAQAIGDLQTLRGLGRPAERVRLEGDDPAGALRALTASIKEKT